MIDLTKRLSEAIELIISGDDMILRKNAQERIVSLANVNNNARELLEFSNI